MKTYISDIIPRIKQFSKKIDNLTLLTNQHWVVLDEISKNKSVYIFRSNNELLISTNGKVEKAKWEYLGNDSLLIDKREESYLFKHGFFDENILALKIDSKEEYVFLINESKYDGELNSLEKVIDFLSRKYIKPQIVNKSKADIRSLYTSYDTEEGLLEMEADVFSNPKNGSKVFLNNKPAPTGKYRKGFMSFVHVVNGEVVATTIF